MSKSKAFLLALIIISGCGSYDYPKDDKVYCAAEIDFMGEYTDKRELYYYINRACEVIESETDIDPVKELKESTRVKFKIVPREKPHEVCGGFACANAHYVWYPEAKFSGGGVQAGHEIAHVIFFRAGIYGETKHHKMMQDLGIY